MADVVNVLVEMGFPKEKAELAVSRTKTDDVQIAMDWLLTHGDELDSAVPTEQIEPATTTTEAKEPEHPEAVPENAGSPGETLVAKSIRCDDCSKLFKSNEEVEFHAAKTGHENFSESTEEKKQLSEDEKKEQLAKIEAKLRQRRLEREAREKEELLLKEKSRIRSGKEMQEAKKKLEDLEMKKIIEQRKREKEEERLAKQRVRDQIEQDKLARKAKFSGTPIETPIAPKQENTIAKIQTPLVDYTHAKLQIKLLDGTTLVQTFGVKEPLSAVRLYVEMNGKDAEVPFKLMTNFPRKVFSLDDYDKPLDSLGLAPSATIFVTKS